MSFRAAVGALNPDQLDEADADALAATVRRAAEVFATPRYKDMVYNCISQDLSWSRPAQKWEGLLEEVMYGKGTAATAKKEAIKVPVQEIIPGDAPAVARAPTVVPRVATSGAASKAPITAPPMGAWRATAPPTGPSVEGVPKVTTYTTVPAVPVKTTATNRKDAMPAAAEPVKTAEGEKGNGVAATPSVPRVSRLVSTAKST